MRYDITATTRLEWIDALCYLSAYKWDLVTSELVDLRIGQVGHFHILTAYQRVLFSYQFQRPQRPRVLNPIKSIISPFCILSNDSGYFNWPACSF